MAEQMTDQAKTAPERIHLKFGRTEALGPTIRMWQASQFEGGIEYIRADLLAEAERRGAERMRERAADMLINRALEIASDSLPVSAWNELRTTADAIRALPLTEKDQTDD